MDINDSVLNFTSFSSLSPSLIWIVFGVALLFTAVYSSILLYHWFRYGIGNKIFSSSVVVIYLSGVMFLLILMALSALSFTL